MVVEHFWMLRLETEMEVIYSYKCKSYKLWQQENSN